MRISAILGLMLAGIWFGCGDKNIGAGYVSDANDPILNDQTLSKEFAESNIELDTKNLENNVRIFLVDKPIDNASFVNVKVEELGIHRTEPIEEWIRVDLNNQDFDLLSLKDGPSAILGDINLEPGSYNLLRLKVSDASIGFEGEDEQKLCVSKNGKRNFVQLKIDLEIPEEHSSEAEIDEELNSLENKDEVVVSQDSFGVVVDFDALESIHERSVSDEDLEEDESQCRYVLRPVLKLKRAAKLFKEKQKFKKKAEHLKEKLEKARERLKEHRENKGKGNGKKGPKEQNPDDDDNENDNDDDSQNNSDDDDANDKDTEREEDDE